MYMLVLGTFNGTSPTKMMNKSFVRPYFFSFSPNVEPCPRLSARLEFEGVRMRTGKEVWALLWGLISSGVYGYAPPENFWIYGFGNAISCVFRRTFSGKKYEGKCCEGSSGKSIFFSPYYDHRWPRLTICVTYGFHITWVNIEDIWGEV